MYRKVSAVLFLVLIAITMLVFAFGIQTAKAEPGIGLGVQIRYGNFSARAYYYNGEPIPLGTSDQDLNDTSWMEFTVQSIQSTNITYEVERHFNNGSDITFLDWTDVSIGPNPSSQISSTRSFPFFCSKNLQAGDTLYNVSRGALYYGWKINDTLQREYLNVTGQTICFNATEPPLWYGKSYYYHLFWDKISGVLTEYNYWERSSSPGVPTREVHFEIVGSSPSWPVPELPSLILPLFMVATVLIVVIGRETPMSTASLEKDGKNRRY